MCSHASLGIVPSKVFSDEVLLPEGFLPSLTSSSVCGAHNKVSPAFNVVFIGLDICFMLKERTHNQKTYAGFGHFSAARNSGVGFFNKKWISFATASMN